MKSWKRYCPRCHTEMVIIGTVNSRKIKKKRIKGTETLLFKCPNCRRHSL